MTVSQLGATRMTVMNGRKGIGMPSQRMEYEVLLTIENIRVCFLQKLGASVPQLDSQEIPVESV